MLIWVFMPHNIGYNHSFWGTYAPQKHWLIPHILCCINTQINTCTLLCILTCHKSLKPLPHIITQMTSILTNGLNVHLFAWVVFSLLLMKESSLWL